MTRRCRGVLHGDRRATFNYRADAVVVDFAVPNWGPTHMTTQPPSLAAAFSLLAAFLAAISAWNFW